MATHARQQYFADENSLSKERREFSIADEIQEKIDSVEEWAQVNKIETVKVNWTALVPDTAKAVNVEVPDVIDNLYTIDSDNALSAKQGKVLYDYIQNIASRWRFLSNWNSATGLPMTNPSESPYPYKSWDYFIVSNVAWLWGTNYRPDGSSYIIWQASTVVETDSVDVSDFYFYDGTNWLLLVNTARQIAVDSSLSTTSTNPVENRVVTNAINWKQEALTVWDWIDIDSNNVISNTWVLSSNNTYDNLIYLSQQDYDNLVTKDPETLYCTPWMPDIYIVDDTPYWASWSWDSTHSPSRNAVYNKINTDLNTKAFTITWATGQSNIDTAQDIYNWYIGWSNPIVMYNNYAYVLSNATGTRLTFRGWLVQQNQNSSSFIWQDIIHININNGTVTTIEIDWAVVGGSYLRLWQNYTTPYTPTNDGDPASKKYVDEHWANIPVYYYLGDFNSDITFNVLEWGEYRLVVRAYHWNTIDKTLTLTVDGVTAGAITSNLIEHLVSHINFTASTWSTVVLSVSSKSNFTIQEVYIEKVNIQSGYLTATVN